MRVVLLPEGKDDFDLYYAESNMEGENVTTKCFEKIGRLSELKKTYEDPIDYFERIAIHKTPSKKGHFTLVIDFNKKLKIGEVYLYDLGYIFPQFYYYQLGLDEVMEDIQKKENLTYDFPRIVRDLVCGRFTSSFKIDQFYQEARAFPEPPDYTLDDVIDTLHHLKDNFYFIVEKAFEGTKAFIDLDTSLVPFERQCFYHTDRETYFKTYFTACVFLDRNGIPIYMDYALPDNEYDWEKMIPGKEKIKERFGKDTHIVQSRTTHKEKGNLRFRQSYRALEREFWNLPEDIPSKEYDIGFFLTGYLALLIFRLLDQRMLKIGYDCKAEDILKSIREYQVLNETTFFIGRMPGGITRKIENSVGLVASFQAISLEDYKEVVALSKEKISHYVIEERKRKRKASK